MDYKKISDTLRDTAIIRLFGFFKIPLLFFVRPTIIELSDENCIVKIALNRRTKNHLNSMYFGVLAIGADCAGGLGAMRLIQKSDQNVSLSFKSFKADFLKRAEGDTYFTCTQGAQIKKFVQTVLKSNIRKNMKVIVNATCPDLLGDEVVAKFELTLSLKRTA